MAFLTFDLARAPTRLAAKPRLGGSLQTVVPFAALSIALIGALPAMRDGVLSMPVREEAASRFTLKYSRFAQASHPTRIDLRIASPNSAEVMVTFSNGFGSTGKLVRIEPSPVSTTYRPGSVSVVFQAPPEGDLALSFHVQEAALGWTSQAVNIGVGRNMSAAMTVDQLVIP
jgi:hypothetical protein